MSPLLFALAAMVLLVMPGPTNLLLAARGQRDGLRGAPAPVLAVILAYGLGIVLVTSLIDLAPALPLALLLKGAAALWLTCLAWRIWRRPELAEMRAGGIGALFVTTLTNPKVVVFATLLIPPGPLLPRLAILAPLIAASSACYLLIGSGTLRLGLSQRVVWRALAAALLGFAGLAATAFLR